jgi:hypothetical protein
VTSAALPGVLSAAAAIIVAVTGLVKAVRAGRAAGAAAAKADAHAQLAHGQAHPYPPAQQP